MTKSIQLDINYKDSIVSATITFDYIPGRPGRYSGPPENCYPDEPGEFGDIKAFVNGEQISLDEAGEDEIVAYLFKHEADF